MAMRKFAFTSIAVVAIQAARVVRDKQQRGDDVPVLAEMDASSFGLTFNGCQCKDECRLNFAVDCNAGRWCHVDRNCQGSRLGLVGRYDYCELKDGIARALSATPRWESLVNNLYRITTPHAYYGGLKVATGVRGESMLDTMTMEQDVFFYPREKYVRPVGVVAPVKFVSNGQHPYTGVFKGNELGIVRLSLSLEPNEKNGFAPGIALKFFREGQPSANILGFTSFIGQNCSENNFFKYNMYTNVPPAEGLSTLVPKKFKQVSSCTQMVGTSDAADDFNGQTPVFPFDVAFQGVQSVDFSCGDLGAKGWANMAKLAKGTRLFDLFAKSSPTAEFEPIGHVDLLDKLTTSSFGDEQLFFRHQRMEEDFQIHPEWLDAIDSKMDCGTSKASTTPPEPKDGCLTIL